MACGRAGNVLLTSSQANPHGFCAKISDFGLARNLDLVSRVETKTTGTVTHMPPEVLSDGIISKAGRTPTQLTLPGPPGVYCNIPKSVSVSGSRGPRSFLGTLQPVIPTLRRLLLRPITPCSVDGICLCWSLRGCGGALGGGMMTVVSACRGRMCMLSGCCCGR